MIFERLSSVIERKATDVSALTWTELFPQNISNSGVSVNVDSALRTTTVFACARVLAEGIAQLPKNLFDVDRVANTKKKNTAHPAYKLLASEPNEWMTSFEFFETMMFHAVLTGNAYAYLGWSGNKIVEIIPIAPNQVQVFRARDWTLTYNVSDLEGLVTTLSADNILHLRGPSWNSYLGMDAVQMAREAIGLSIATEQTHASLHANGAQPGGVLSVKGKLDKDARERLKAAWQAFQGGVQNRFKTAVLDVDAAWQPLSMSGVDSQHLETRRFQIEEICRAMRVFPQMVMHSDKTSTFASAGAFFQAHVDHSLMPWVLRWEQAINRTILGDDDSLECRFNVASFLRGDASTRGDFYMKALGGARGETAWMTRNEVRELEDMNPIDGGDKLLVPAVTDPTPPTQTGTDPVVKALELVLAAKFNPNHDDRGRFDTGDGGGGGGSGSNSGQHNAERSALITHFARFDAKHTHDYDPNLILIKSDSPQFTLNGKQFNAAGLAHISGDRLGQIELFPSAIHDDGQGSPIRATKQILAHEIMHQKFQAFLNEADSSQKSVVNHTALQRADGVSDYSYEYWKAYADSRSQVDGSTASLNNAKTALNLAVHETLAEIARAKVKAGRDNYWPDHMGERIISYREKFPSKDGSTDKPPQSEIDSNASLWKDLYTRVGQHWKNRAK
jgi:HK97 family phage portal protein